MAKEKMVEQKDDVYSADEIAEAIVNLDKAIRHIFDGPLTEECLLILLSHKSGISISTIKNVFKSLNNLKSNCIKARK